MKEEISQVLSNGERCTTELVRAANGTVIEETTWLLTNEGRKVKEPSPGYCAKNQGRRLEGGDAQLRGRKLQNGPENLWVLGDIFLRRMGSQGTHACVHMHVQATAKELVAREQELREEAGQQGSIQAFHRAEPMDEMERREADFQVPPMRRACDELARLVAYKLNLKLDLPLKQWLTEGRSGDELVQAIEEAPISGAAPKHALKFFAATNVCGAPVALEQEGLQTDNVFREVAFEVMHPELRRKSSLFVPGTSELKSFFFVPGTCELNPPSLSPAQTNWQDGADTTNDRDWARAEAAAQAAMDQRSAAPPNQVIYHEDLSGGSNNGMKTVLVATALVMGVGAFCGLFSSSRGGLLEETRSWGPLHLGFDDSRQCSFTESQLLLPAPPESPVQADRKLGTRQDPCIPPARPGGRRCRRAPPRSGGMRAKRRDATLFSAKADAEIGLETALKSANIHFPALQIREDRITLDSM
ncbi:hypothetical protein AK812_SmicGene19808 [Symbiodinium microadriaticum]|uniref:Uncharacterized protein n=1 Tax=Symbiodinium microadriaticum TaxID=2951 RepID=A0A1Q9DRM2_SYMMI|nr:hypothetical protein AK812_SmicGene19808 [Symbiodinium microadriaticum]